jgi:UDP-N-acetylmuramyl pentapeptide synthase
MQSYFHSCSLVSAKLIAINGIQVSKCKEHCYNGFRTTKRFCAHLDKETAFSWAKDRSKQVVVEIQLDSNVQPTAIQREDKGFEDSLFIEANFDAQAIHKLNVNTFDIIIHNVGA